MAGYNYETLSPLDHSFLLQERPNAFMHVASVATFDGTALRTPDGGIDIERIRRRIAGVLHRVPHYRQKLDQVPITGAPIWIDDDAFNLEFHVRHTSLPRPGNRAQLKRLAARVMAGHLDRERPLWELWVVEGLEDGQFAIINKTHHAMVDGTTGVDLMNVLMSRSEDVQDDEPPTFVPRRPPTPSELAWDEVGRQVRLPFEIVQDASNLWRAARNTRRGLLNRIRQIAEYTGTSLRPATLTPLNQRIGPHRRLDWTTQPLGQLKEIRQQLGGTLNDVVLTLVAGAVRRFLIYRRLDLDAIDFRVLAPISVAGEELGVGATQPRVSAWFVPLPLAESDPATQLSAVADTTRDLEASKPAVGASQLTGQPGWTPSTLLSLGARNATRLNPYNMVVTNVPGPQVPLYLLGSRMLETYPVVPLVEGVGLSVAVFSYDGDVHWGINADYELVPDLDRFIAFLDEAFIDLGKAAADKKRLRAKARRARKARKAQPAAQSSAKA